MKVKILTIVLVLVAATVHAQQKKRVTIGGGNRMDTSDWPKITASATTDPAISAALRAYLDEMVKRDLFSGTVLVARNGKPVFFQSYGLADKAARVPNNNDTKYNLGSINKVFTQIALQQLRDQGRIDFDQTLRTYLRDYPSDIADRITIRQIFEHRSGLGDTFGPAYDAADRSKLRSLKDYMPLFIEKPLEFEPGTAQRYSNAGYIVLGLVIERLTGMSYYDYVRKNIFEPAGMKDTDSWAVDEKVPNRAIGYAKREPNFSTLPARGSSAGGGYSTASDMLRFVQALHARKLTKNAPQGGAGWGGGAPGINAMVEDEGEWVIVVLSNYDPPAAQEVARNARTLVGVANEE